MLQMSEHADHEFTQIIVLVALLRRHFQRMQDKHTHRGVVTSKVGRKMNGRGMGGVTNSAGVGPGGDNAAKLKVPAIARAKMIIANSFENLRSSKPSETLDRSRKSSGASDQSATQTLFARKSSIGTLMSPVHSKSSSTDEDTSSELLQVSQREGRSRSSWTSDTAIRPPRLVLDSEESEVDRGGVEEEPSWSSVVTVAGEVEPTGNTSPDLSHLSRTQSWRGLRNMKRTPFLSLTPPSSSTNKVTFNKNHRRAVSHEIGNSWRQEIFDSILTPGKSENGHHKIRTSTDICKGTCHGVMHMCVAIALLHIDMGVAMV